MLNYIKKKNTIYEKINKYDKEQPGDQRNLGSLQLNPFCLLNIFQLPWYTSS